jgi:hypothetical protein
LVPLDPVVLSVLAAAVVLLGSSVLVFLSRPLRPDRVEGWAVPGLDRRLQCLATGRLT